MTTALPLVQYVHVAPLAQRSRDALEVTNRNTLASKIHGRKRMSLFDGAAFRRLSLFAVGLAAVAIFVGSTLADTLELRSGQVIEGKFLDGSPLNIRFRVDGKIETFATRDVLNIGFSDSSSDSVVAPAPAPPSASSQAPAGRVAPAVAANPAVSAPAAPSDHPAAVAANAPAPASAAPSSASGMHAVTIPAGTSLLVRMIDSVDSSTNKVGDPFQASLEGPLVIGDTVVAAKGADVYGKLAQAQSSGQLSGHAQLTLELTGIRINGQTVHIESTDYDVAGASRGKQSAERIGGGAVLGAVIGAIAGGGKGAAVGAAVGGGAGTAAQVLTHGPQVRVPSETLLEFKLQQAATVQIPN
jgi:hypothetical protein